MRFYSPILRPDDGYPRVHPRYDALAFQLSVPSLLWVVDKKVFFAEYQIAPSVVHSQRGDHRRSMIAVAREKTIGSVGRNDIGEVYCYVVVDGKK